MNISEILDETTCPACGYQLVVPFYDGGDQPLATLAWPKSKEEAVAMERLPLAFKRCVDCGHVFNAEFDYGRVPYSDKPNLMFNQGTDWREHLHAIRDQVLARLPENPTVVEIGCGDAHFLSALAEARPGGRYFGFDPHAAAKSKGSMEIRCQLFDPFLHLTELRPDMIVSRHVFEHLKNPSALLQKIGFAANWNRIPVQLFIEVPCIDRVFDTGRTSDFFYEHNSHFTTTSLTRMLQRCSGHVDRIARGYRDEVVFGFARLGLQPECNRHAEESLSFRQRAESTRANVKARLAELLAAGSGIAIWGGTGKAAAFINYFGLDAGRFPVVVDSDPDKAGTHVPGTGQEIRFRDYLLEHPLDFILIPSQWRARDIAQEIARHRIPHKAILIEHDGRLVDFLAGGHPY